MTKAKTLKPEYLTQVVLEDKRLLDNAVRYLS